MVVSATAFTDNNNGYEQTTDGLWIHTGSMSVGPGFRDPSKKGAAVLSVNGRTDGAGDYGLQVRNRSVTRNNLLVRDDGYVIADSLIVSNVATLPAGSTYSYLGTYRNVVAYYVPAANAWYESTAQVNVTTTGGRLRCEGSGSIVSSTLGAQVYIGLYLDGGLAFDSLTAGTIPGANYSVPFAFTAYVVPGGPGSHRVSIAVYANVANSSGLWSGVYTNLFVTEQRG